MFQNEKGKEKPNSSDRAYKPDDNALCVVFRSPKSIPQKPNTNFQIMQAAELQPVTAAHKPIRIHAG